MPKASGSYRRPSGLVLAGVLLAAAACAEGDAALERLVIPEGASLRATAGGSGRGVVN